MHTHTYWPFVSWKRGIDFLLASVSPLETDLKRLYLEEEEDHDEEGKGERKGGCYSVFPSSGREGGEEEKRARRESVGEVNCRKLRGSVRGPAPVSLWGRDWGSWELCRSEKGRRPVNQFGEREEMWHRAKTLVWMSVMKEKKESRE